MAISNIRGLYKLAVILACNTGLGVRTYFDIYLFDIQQGHLILLCYKCGRRQQGHLGRERARWVAIWRRRVAMECGLCRSVLTGSASWRGASWQSG